MMKQRLQNQRGLTLIELMISLALGLALTAGAISVFQQNKETYQFQEAMARLQENGRYAMNVMARDIRSSGYRGCRSRMANSNSTGINSAFLYNVETTFNESSEVINFQRGISGYEAVNDDGGADDWDDSDGNDLDASIFAETPNSGSDILVLRTIRGGNRTATMAACSEDNGQGDVTISSTLGTNLQQFDTAIVANCESASVFVVTNSPSTAVAHDTTSSASSRTTRHVSGIANTDTNFNICYGEGGVADGSVLSRIVNVVYYIDDNADGIPALYRMENGGTATELLEDVEEMQFLYGEDTDNDLVVNGFVTADNVTNWSNVLAMRVSLLVRSSRNNIVDNAQVLYYDRNGDDTITTTSSSADEYTATDNRVRKVFSTTVAMRNRMS